MRGDETLFVVAELNPELELELGIGTNLELELELDRESKLELELELELGLEIKVELELELLERTTELELDVRLSSFCEVDATDTVFNPLSAGTSSTSFANKDSPPQKGKHDLNFVFFPHSALTELLCPPTLLLLILTLPPEHLN